MEDFFTSCGALYAEPSDADPATNFLVGILHGPEFEQLRGRARRASGRGGRPGRGSDSRVLETQIGPADNPSEVGGPAAGEDGPVGPEPPAPPGAFQPIAAIV
eukprot:1601338-Pyramimonas_sp.AAC.2